MNNAIYNFELPKNELVNHYQPGSHQRKQLMQALDQQASETIDIPLIIGGKEIQTKNKGILRMPHNHKHILASYSIAGQTEIEMAAKAAVKARQNWMSLSWLDRASVFLKAAEMISEKYRYKMNAATMLGQSKSAYQAEIDSACEVIDFLRFNAYYASEIYSKQPVSEFGNLNRLEYRSLEGFILAITPFNFTAIASNLNAAPALMGNTLVWKPASTSVLSNYYLMKIFMEAGLPDGVINFIPSSGRDISAVALKNKHLAGIHFTGSTSTFNHLWRATGENLGNYISYPKLIGETGGKDFILVHQSANFEEVGTAIIRGAFEYQGQKCSAASRAYIPASMWPKLKPYLIERINDIKMGDVRDFSNFMNAVIDEASYLSIMDYIQYAEQSAEATILAGGKGDRSEGYFIRPTLIQVTNPHFKTMEEEIFGPVMTVYVYDDNDFEKIIDICDQTSPYALTGSVFSNDRYALNLACSKLRYAAGNLYYNDKPSGAVVGQQPFGGARASGTNDKSGSYLNLLRWTSPRTIKETFTPPTDYKYPHMNGEGLI
ncbi:MAG: L-glutamate gamma-semialdehyde dehydrogenase [Lentimicrobiaceae bacterium]|nr:L-glutamate gamma-semialdehyde dehydrogenase [Lentimicrobiaceae bacterium]